jgi:hypothetical protein
MRPLSQRQSSISFNISSKKTKVFFLAPTVIGWKYIVFALFPPSRFYKVDHKINLSTKKVKTFGNISI